MGAEQKQSNKDHKPLVSIVTVVYNGQSHLQEAIDSVRHQTYPNIEYILIDGGSTDGTVEIIKKNADFVSDWVSEPDGGIYDAMNKGVRRATGTYIGLLNADDLLLPDGVARSVEALEKLDGPGYTCAAVELADEKGRPYAVSAPLPYEEMVKRRFIEIPCPHLGVFVHRRLYEQIGAYDLRFRLSADYDFILRLIHHEAPCIRLTHPVGVFRKGGASGGVGTWLEIFKLHRKHGRHFSYACYVFTRSIVKSSLARIAPNGVKRRIRLIAKSKNAYY